MVASLGVDSGYVPYTAYSAKTALLRKIRRLYRALPMLCKKGMDYVNSHTPEEIAKVIQPQFKETDLDTITTIVQRYYEQDTWNDNLVYEQKSFDLLQDILESAGELTKRAPYDNLVNTTFAEKAAK